MARRRESLFDVLLVCPWWVAVSFGVVGYVLIVLIAPLAVTDGLLAPVVRNLRPLANLWALFFGVAAISSAARRYLIARKLNQQHAVEDLRSLSWRQFEKIVGEAFRRRGYSVTENAVDGPDGGVDLILRKDGGTFLVQCKHWKHRRVGVKPIRELFGVISARRATGGFFVTSGRYTPEARAFARSSGVELIDGPGLMDLIQEARRPGGSSVRC